MDYVTIFKTFKTVDQAVTAIQMLEGMGLLLMPEASQTIDLAKPGEHITTRPEPRTRVRIPREHKDAIEQVLTAALPTGLSKAAIAEETKLSRGELTKALDAMQRAGLLHVDGSQWIWGKKAPAIPARQRSPSKAAKRPGASLGDGILAALRDRDGQSREDIQTYLASTEVGPVRPNHLGIGIQRHVRAGRIEQRAGLNYLTAAGRESPVVQIARRAPRGRPRTAPDPSTVQQQAAG